MKHPAPAEALTAVGLACWLATLPLYSNAITPFQRFPGLALFVGDFALQVLGISAAIALAVAAFSLLGHHVRKAALGVVGAASYACAAGLFVWACLVADPASLPWVGLPLSALFACGCVATGLLWGRAIKGFTARQSLRIFTLTSLFSAALGCIALTASVTAYAFVYALEVACAVALPWLVGLQQPECETGLDAQGLIERPLAERLRSFTDVAAPALVGLLAFAFVMGTMRFDIVETYPIHLAVLVLCACILGFFAFRKTDRPLMQTAYRSLIPALAVLQLAITNITTALSAHAGINTFAMFLLYTLAALLTLATLGAISNAGEFPCDLVVSVAIMLFCLASFAGLKTAELLTAEQLGATTTVITTVYAFSMVILTGIRTNHAASPADPLGENPTPQNSPNAAAQPPAAPTVEERCQQLAGSAHLTARETEILSYLAKGHGSSYIGDALYISPNTVRTHVHNIYRKLNVASREEIVDLVTH